MDTTSQDDRINKFIGFKRIKEIIVTDDKTPSGADILLVKLDDASVERYSSLMLNNIVTDKKVDLTTLRDKRIQPIVQVTLSVLRDYGIKLGELQYFSVLLQQSLDFNHKEALNLLWSKYIPKPKEPEEVDLLTIDKVLKDASKPE